MDAHKTISASAGLKAVAIDAQKAIPLPQASRLAALSGERLRRRILCGEITAELVGGRWMVDPASLADWIRQNRAEPQPAA